MDTSINVIEAHLDGTGKTLPLRQMEAKKSGNLFWAILNQKKDGSRYFGSFGVNVPIATTGPIDKVDSIRVDQVGTVKVKHDVTTPYTDPKTGKSSPGGKKRITAEKEFTAPDGVKWVFEFRATLSNPEVVNVKASIRRKGAGGNLNVQTTL